MLTFIVLAAILIIVFVFSLQAMRVSAMFSRGSSVIVALCVATLSTLGLLRMFHDGAGPVTDVAGNVTAAPVAATGTPTDTTTDADGGPWLDFVLLPYAALAIAMVVVLLGCWVARIWRGLCRRPAKKQWPSSIASSLADDPDDEEQWERRWR